MEENKCPQCGAPIDPNEKECKFCGEKIVVQQKNVASGISINISNDIVNFSDDGEISGMQKTLAVSAHLGYLLGGIGFLLWPLGLYLFAEKRMPFLAQHAIQAFKAQIAIIVLTAVVAMSAISGGITMIVLACCVGGVLVPFSFYAAYKAINEQAYYYPLLNGGFTKKKAIILGGFLIALFLFSFALSGSSDKKESSTSSLTNTTNSSTQQKKDRQEKERQEKERQEKERQELAAKKKEEEKKKGPYNYELTSDGSVYLGVSNGGMAVTIVEIGDLDKIDKQYVKPLTPSKGIFKTVVVYVANNGKDEKIIGKFVLKDENGRQYSSDDSATRAARDNLNWRNVTSLEPNEREWMVAVFDIPQNTNIVRLLYKPWAGRGKIIEIPFEVKKK